MTCFHRPGSPADLEKHLRLCEGKLEMLKQESGTKAFYQINRELEAEKFGLAEAIQLAHHTHVVSLARWPFADMLTRILQPVDLADVPEVDRVCAICYENYPDSSHPQADHADRPVRLSCGHVIGAACIGTWLSTAEPSGGLCATCPTCRQAPYLPCEAYQSGAAEDGVIERGLTARPFPRWPAFALATLAELCPARWGGRDALLALRLHKKDVQHSLIIHDIVREPKYFHDFRASGLDPLAYVRAHGAASRLWCAYHVQLLKSADVAEAASRTAIVLYLAQPALWRAAGEEGMPAVEGLAQVLPLMWEVMGAALEHWALQLEPDRLQACRRVLGDSWPLDAREKAWIVCVRSTALVWVEAMNRAWELKKAAQEANLSGFTFKSLVVPATLHDEESEFGS